MVVIIIITEGTLQREAEAGWGAGLQLICQTKVPNDIKAALESVATRSILRSFFCRTIFSGLYVVLEVKTHQPKNT